MSAASRELAALAGEVNHWRADPVYFCKHYFKFNADSWQKEFLSAKHNKIAVRSGHGVGKTGALAMKAWHFMFTNYPFKIPCTAPSGHQLDDLLWPEMSKWHEKLPKSLQRGFKFVGDYIRPTSDFTNKGDSFMVKRTARLENPDALQGFHGPHMLFIIDEASGVPAKVFEVVRGALTEVGNAVVMTGNPTTRYGYFYDAFTKHRHRFKTMQVSCWKARLVSNDYCQEMLDDYGENNNVYRIRVLGEFPRADTDSVISIDHLERAIAKGPDLISIGEVVWGVDVGGAGEKADATTLGKRSQNLILEPVKAWTSRDHDVIAGLLAREYDDTPDHVKPEAIYVDSIGLGAAVVKNMKDLGLPAIGVNVSESTATDYAQYRRLRDELWVRASEWFKSPDTGFAQDDPRTVAELSSVHWHDQSGKGGKLYIEEKADTVKRLTKQTGAGHSPDKADCIVMTFRHRWKSKAHLNPQAHYRVQRRMARTIQTNAVMNDDMVY